MAPTRSKKQKSSESSSSLDVANCPAPPTAAPKQSPFQTPTRSPIKKKPTGITMKQKQALIHNLQLEITERARKLRAQYILQAHGLRTRVEMRINRIPTALRKMTMEDLMQKYADGTKHPATRAMKHAHTPNRGATRQREQDSPSPRKPKRKSDEMSTGDKENEDMNQQAKRARAPAAATRNVSRAKLAPNLVLSPKSSNSRYVPQASTAGRTTAAKTIPRSPGKPVASNASAASLLSNMVDRAKSTRGATTKKTTTASTAGTTRGKRAAAAAAKRSSGVSEASESSTGTTIIHRPAPEKKAPAKRGVIGTIKGMGTTSTKKAPASKTTTTTTGARVLRKRN